MSGVLRWLDRWFPRFAFARRVPPGQIATRLARQARARLFGVAAPAPLDISLVDRRSLPVPPVGPRGSVAVRQGDGWLFTFLGRTLAMTRTIDWSAPSHDRADQLWRMNLHYMEYLGSLSAHEAVDAIRQWIVANPADAPGAEQAPWNAYALSIRLVEWLRFLARPDADLPESDRLVIEQSLAAQLAFLLARPETDIGGNHLVRNVRALMWAAACCQGPDLARLRERGRAMLRAVLTDQILADGMHFELSPSYHCQVLGDLIDCRAALAPEHDEALENAIDRMFAAARIMTHRDGLIAQFGDSGLTMAPSLKDLAGALGHDTAEPVSGVLPDGGFAAHCDGPLSLIARFGRIAANSLPAHAHADAGSIEIAGPSGRIFVDQGVDVYVAGAHRTVSRAAASHNITVAGDAEMADFFGDFRMGRRPQVRGTASLGACGLCVETSHDGFRDNRGGLWVTRRITTDGWAVCLRDCLNRASPDPVRTAFLLHPDCAARLTDGGVAISGGGMQLRLTGAGSWAIEPAAWWPNMGAERPTHRIVCQWPASNTDNSFNLTSEGTMDSQ